MKRDGRIWMRLEHEFDSSSDEFQLPETDSEDPDLDEVLGCGDSDSYTDSEADSDSEAEPDATPATSPLAAKAVTFKDGENRT